MDSSYQSSWSSAPLSVTTTVESNSWYSTIPHETAVLTGSTTATHSPIISSNGPASEEIRSPTSPLSMLGFGMLGEYNSSEKKVNRDGQPAKRRGPKPDNKPAMTRRQALNRQAQRTHRQKKENYIRALEEQHVLLKGAYNESIQEKETILAENRMLKNLLRAHGISPQKRYSSASSDYIDTLSISDNQPGAYSRPPNQHLEQYGPVAGDLSRPNPAGYFPSEVTTLPQRVLSQNQSQLHPPEMAQSTMSNYSDTEVDFTLSSVPRTNYFDGTMRPRVQPPPRQSSSPSFLQNRSSG